MAIQYYWDRVFGPWFGKAKVSITLVPAQIAFARHCERTEHTFSAPWRTCEYPLGKFYLSKGNFRLGGTLAAAAGTQPNISCP